VKAKLNYTHPLLHLAMASNVAISFVNENWYAAIAWGTAWTFCFMFDYFYGKRSLDLKMLQLFVTAHKGKWPSKEAEEHARDELHAFLKGSK
jgi:hypothetical protein